MPFSKAYLTAVDKSSRHAARVVIDLRLIDVVDDSVSDVLAFGRIVATHPKRREICRHEIVARLAIDHIVVEPRASFFVPQHFFDTLQ